MNSIIEAQLEFEKCKFDLQVSNFLKIVREDFTIYIKPLPTINSKHDFYPTINDIERVIKNY